MRKGFLLPCLLLICTIVSAQYKEGQIYLKLKANTSFSSFKERDATILNNIKTAYSVNFIARTFPHLNDKKLNTLYTISFPIAMNEDALMEALKSISAVEYAERVPEYRLFLTPNDPLQNQQWYLGATYINAYNAWTLNSGSASVKLAIVDDEVRVTHEDLQSKIYTNTAEIAGNGIDDDNNGYIDDRNGWDAADNDNNPNRPLSAPVGTMIHGTHCAGIATAASNNSLGVASVGFGVSLIPVKVNKDVNTSGSLDNPYGGVEYAIAAKANVVSMSWGGSGYSQSEQLLFNYGYSQGIVFVAAAGNSSSSSVFYPAGFNHVISVASSTTNDLKSGFSNYGSWVDITAPGSNIYSCLGNADNAYGFLSGTSMACPMVAGLCALMLSKTPSLTPDVLENCLKLSADNIDAKNPAYVGQLGGGRINALNALKCLPCLAKASFNIGANSQQNYAVGSNIFFTSTGFGSTYKWLLNGTVASSLSSFSQVFNTKGNYSIKLVTVDNTASCTDTVTKYFTVFDSLPTVCQPLQNSNWFFGANAGVTFTTDPPTAIQGNINIVNGSSSASDQCGNLIFYSDGMSVWDKSGTVMPNGTGLLGSSTSCRSALIVPKTDSAGVYYVFTIDYNQGANGLNYSIVDMRNAGNGTIANPMGSVRVKNIAVSASACERQTAILHSNGRDYWLITHDCNNNNYYSILVTSTGVSSPTTIAIANDNFTNSSTDGDMRFSPDGTKLAVAYFIHASHNLNLYDFNRATGTLSTPLQLAVGTSTSSACAYGVEFSPDCSKLYVTTMCGSPQLIQYDINTTTTTPIFTETIASGEPYGFGEMLRGPNNKIYVNRWGYSTLGVIHNPNGLGLACNYCESATPTCGSPAVSGLNLKSGTSCKAGLTSGVKNTFSGCSYSFQAKDSCINYPIGFSINDPVFLCKGGTTYAWNFGDVSSSANTSSLQNPSHVFVKTGTYLISLKIYSPCDTVSLSKNITVICCGSIDNISSRTTICQNDTAQIFAAHTGTSYAWSPATSLFNASVNNPKAFPTSSTKYVVNITNGNGCQNADTVYVDVVAKPVASIIEGKNCTSDTLSVLPIPAFYAWSNGKTNQPIVAIQSGTYSVLIRNAYGCYISLSTNVTIVPAIPIITRTGNQLCASTMSVHYQWFKNNAALPNDTMQCLTITSSGSYYVEVTDRASNCTNISIKKEYALAAIEQNGYLFEAILLPNPNNGTFTLKWDSRGGDLSAIIFNSLGQLVYESVLSKNISQTQLTLSEQLASGQYVLQLKSKDGVQQIRFEVIQ